MENNYKINDKVKENRTNIYGKIKQLNNKKVTITMPNGNLFQTTIDKISPYEYKENKNEITVTYSRNYTKFNNEIMLRLKQKDEALFLLDNFMKEAIINKEQEVRIIHGKHGGIIREAVHDYLRNCKYVESFGFAGYYDGQFGVTIAKLKIK